MTLQNGLVTQSAAYLWSETGLFTWETRELVGHENKIFVGAGWPWALIHSGTEDVWSEVEYAICAAQPSSLGVLVDCIQAALKPHLGHEWQGGQRVLIAAYDEGPQLLIIGTKELAGYPPLAPVPIHPHMVSSDSAAIRREVSRGVTPETMAGIIRQQHKDSTLEGHWPLAGKVTRARVSRDGVDVIELDELPDPTMT